jgi:hypothetical protein
MFKVKVGEVMNLRMILRMYQFSLELLLGILLLFFFVIGKNAPLPLGILVGFSLGTFYLVSLLLEKVAGKSKWGFFLIALLLLLIAGKAAGQPILLMGILGLLVIWRGIALYDPKDQHEVIILLFSYMAGLIVLVYSSMLTYPFRNQIVYILFFQVLLVFIGGFLKKWVRIHNDKFGFAIFFIKLCAIIGGFAGLITLIMKFLEVSLSGFMKYTAMLLGQITIPILNLLKHFKLGKQPYNTESNQNMPDLFKEANAAKNHAFFMTKDVFFISLLVIGIICLFFFVYKRRSEITMTWLDKSTPAYISEIIKGPSIRLFNGKQSPPEDFIRNEIFKFEKYAQRHHNGRYPFETLEEWLERIGLTGREQTISVYEKTRYGGIISSHEEQLYFKNEIRQMKQQLYSRKDYET